jgi:hypothetical protein
LRRLLGLFVFRWRTFSRVFKRSLERRHLF